MSIAKLPAGPTLTDDGGYDRNPQPAHLPEVDGDRLGLAPLLGTDAGVGARGIDQGDDGQLVFFSELHFEQRLTVALGVGATEVAGDPLAGVFALVVGDDQAFVWPDRRPG